MSSLGARKPLPASGDADPGLLLAAEELPRQHSLNHILGDFQLPRMSDFCAEAVSRTGE
jgi:hypothetical protein